MTMFAGVVEMAPRRSRLRPFVPPESAGWWCSWLCIIGLMELRVLLEISPAVGWAIS
jgi:hypothetical protein